MSKIIPQHLTLSVSPKGKVHFVSEIYYSQKHWGKATFLTLCGLWIPLGNWGMNGSPEENHISRPVTCARCLAAIKERGWIDD